jgi:hypothetical protein
MYLIYVFTCCPVYLYTSGLCKLILVLNEDALFQWIPFSTIVFSTAHQNKPGATTLGASGTKPLFFVTQSGIK